MRRIVRDWERLLQGQEDGRRSSGTPARNQDETALAARMIRTKAYRRLAEQCEPLGQLRHEYSVLATRGFSASD